MTLCTITHKKLDFSKNYLMNLKSVPLLNERPGEITAPDKSFTCNFMGDLDPVVSNQVALTFLTQRNGEEMVVK